MSNKEPARILVVDDEIAQMRALCDTLSDHGYHAVGLDRGEAAIETLRDEPFDLLLADLAMPRMNGIELLQKAHEINPDLVSVIMTGEGTITTAVEAMKSGALDYILKPFKLSFILPVLERALAVRHLRLANAELERNVRQRTVELETANKELEAFAHSVSHDLRSPMTVIMACAEHLIEEYGSALPAEARMELERVTTSIERMKQLIDDLLRLSRLGRQSLQKQNIKIIELVDDALGEIAASHPSHLIEVRRGELADCVGDPGLIKQVLVNLLSNAFKFTRGVAHPTVEITCKDDLEQKIYCIKDNGAGFDVQHARNLFGAFQRFHSTSQFEGTGVGLSIVHRIVERHGGRIWASSEVNKGASFYFTIPS